VSELTKHKNYGHKLDSLGLLGCVAYKPSQLDILHT